MPRRAPGLRPVCPSPVQWPHGCRQAEAGSPFPRTQAVEGELQRLATWAAKTAAECVIISMDGCRKDSEEEEGVKLAGWAARCSDGGEWHGVLTPPFNDNYMAEMRAQIAVAERCKVRRVSNPRLRCDLHQYPSSLGRGWLSVLSVLSVPVRAVCAVRAACTCYTSYE